MRLTDELEFIRALPEEGCLILTAERDERGRLRTAIDQACGLQASGRVVILIADRDEQMKLVRANVYDGNRCWPKITKAAIAAADDAAKLARLTVSMATPTGPINTTVPLGRAA